MHKKVTVIAGGVGGAKLVEGLYHYLPHENLSIVPNVGDDDEFHGLYVSPDVDTLVYTLAHLVNRDAGWGLKSDSFKGLAMLKQLGQQDWMSLGDEDLGLHIFRTMRRLRGERPSEIASDIARSLGVKSRVILPTDDEVKTVIETDIGLLSMEEYFVKERCKPDVVAVRYSNSEQTTATVDVIKAIQQADILIFAPSNPIASIGPILAIKEIRSAIESSLAYRVAMSPLVGGKAVKGPASEMMVACGYESNVKGVAAYYYGLLDAIVIDEQDRQYETVLKDSGTEISPENI